jgi:23S rRNA pseudouridine1911/1915/1917 synthase
MTEERLRATVQPADAGARLDRVLAAQLGGLSRTRLKRLIEDGQVSLDGDAVAVTDPAMKVKPGQVFVIRVPPPETGTIAAQKMDLAIVFEDRDLLVLDKPAGLVVHPAPGNPDRTLVNALLAHCGESLAGIGGVKRPGIVHRLDKDTSGLMVVAKTDAVHQALSRDFAAHTITRAYQAVVWGVPQPGSGEISNRIGRSPRNRKKMAVVRERGKTAITRYQLLKAFKDKAALVECRLATGRTHQIRVHLSEKGNPLLGDPVYGRRGGARLTGLPEGVRLAISALGRQALHAYLLGFRHPTSGEYLEFRSRLPNDISDLIHSLERM